MQGTIFNIQHFSIHDGPGIRTTAFLKGCPLRCAWCHNPEGILRDIEPMWYEEKCRHCHACVREAPEGCFEFKVSGKGESLRYHPEACRGSLFDFDACHYGALEIKGRKIEAAELAGCLAKDRLFFETSGGGVTFSGGEPLLQADFLKETAEIIKEMGIHIAVDTCGQLPFSDFEKVLPLVDLFLFDYKHSDPVMLKKYTGADYKLVLANLEKLSERAALIDLRIPYIGNVNVNEAFLEGLEKDLRRIKVRNIHILPYHRYGTGKYERMGKKSRRENFYTPSEEELEVISKRLGKYADVFIGG